MKFSDCVVIVTGGAQGIGAGICKAFVESGANVVFGDQNKEKGLKFEQDWNAKRKDKEGQLTFFHWEARSPSQCKALVDYTIQKYNRLDVLVNNVGIQPKASYVPAHELSDEYWDMIHEVNLKSFFLMTKYCVPHFLKKKDGMIINISSCQGTLSQEGVSAYASTKGAILSLTRALSIDYGKHNIRVNSISPGAIETELSAENSDYTYIINNTPLGKIGQVRDIAQMVLSICGSAWVTGQNFVVDGGISIKGGWCNLGAAKF